MTKPKEEHWKVLTTEVTVAYKDHNPIFGEGVTKISVEDEAAGSFLVINQMNDTPSKVRFDWDEWDKIVEVVAAHRKEWDWKD